MRHYILDDKGRPVVEADFTEWARWFEKAERHVADERIGDVQISTVFLGLDHAARGSTPVLWETMAFGGRFDQVQDRCSGSWEQAEAMHARMVERVKRTISKVHDAGSTPGDDTDSQAHGPT
jgi:hypothetical protein